MAYEFKKDESLEKEHRVKVFAVSKDYVTLESCFPLGCSWCQWLEDSGWTIYTPPLEAANPYRDWNRYYITNIKRKPTNA